MFAEKLTYDVASEWLRYDPETGDIFWTKDQGKRRAGKIAGGSLMKGYKRLRIDGQAYSHHRVAWLLMAGEWPKGEIDHINHVRTDNRWCNLREATRSQNAANIRGRGKLGFPKGVRRSRNKFAAQACHEGRMVHVGVFDTVEQAHAAYLKRIAELHGEFACGAPSQLGPKTF